MCIRDRGSTLSDDEKAELDIHAAAFDGLFTDNGKSPMFKQTEGCEEENPNSGDGDENPGVENTESAGTEVEPSTNGNADESGASDATIDGKSLDAEQVIAFIAANKISKNHSEIMRGMLEQ